MGVDFIMTDDDRLDLSAMSREAYFPASDQEPLQRDVEEKVVGEMPFGR